MFENLIQLINEYRNEERNINKPFIEILKILCANNDGIIFNKLDNDLYILYVVYDKISNNDNIMNVRSILMNENMKIINYTVENAKNVYFDVFNNSRNELENDAELKLTLSTENIIYVVYKYEGITYIRTTSNYAKEINFRSNRNYEELFFDSEITNDGKKNSIEEIENIFNFYGNDENKYLVFTLNHNETSFLCEHKKNILTLIDVRSVETQESVMNNYDNTLLEINKVKYVTYNDVVKMMSTNNVFQNKKMEYNGFYYEYRGKHFFVQTGSYNYASKYYKNYGNVINEGCIEYYGNGNNGYNYFCIIFKITKEQHEEIIVKVKKMNNTLIKLLNTFTEFEFTEIEKDNGRNNYVIKKYKKINEKLHNELFSINDHKIFKHILSSIQTFLLHDKNFKNMDNIEYHIYNMLSSMVKQGETTTVNMLLSKLDDFVERINF